MVKSFFCGSAAYSQDLIRFGIFWWWWDLEQLIGWCHSFGGLIIRPTIVVCCLHQSMYSSKRAIYVFKNMLLIWKIRRLEEKSWGNRPACPRLLKYKLPLRSKLSLHFFHNRIQSMLVAHLMLSGNPSDLLPSTTPKAATQCHSLCKMWSLRMNLNSPFATTNTTIKYTYNSFTQHPQKNGFWQSDILTHNISSKSDDR